MIFSYPLPSQCSLPDALPSQLSPIPTLCLTLIVSIFPRVISLHIIERLKVAKQTPYLESMEVALIKDKGKASGKSSISATLPKIHQRLFHGPYY
ncbi:hypothetical protein Ddc_16063 [Ditylenchus destructor]|nr:hypothetical protein Ddc_16063 [Ditylenchus destructor]